MSDATNTTRFWMVWNPSGRQPHVRHQSRAKADREASRLSAANPNQQFYVLKAVGGFVSEVSEPPKIALTPPLPVEDDEIPF